MEPATEKPIKDWGEDAVVARNWGQFRLLAVPSELVGSLSNDNGDGNENVTNLHI